MQSILHKQHLRRDHLNNYIRGAIERISPNSDEILLRDYEKAFQYSGAFQTEMTQVAKELRYLLNESLSQINQNVLLHKLSLNIPEFNSALLEEQNQLRKQKKTADDIFGVRLSAKPELDVFGARGAGDAIDSLIQNRFPASATSLHGTQARGARLPEHPASENFQCLVDQSRKRVNFGRLFHAVSSASILKLHSLASGQKDISCICALADDLLAVAGRFSPFVEVYAVAERALVAKIDTETVQGVKCLLFLRRDVEEPAQWDSQLIVGTYSDEDAILSYRLDVVRAFSGGRVSVAAKTAKRYEKKHRDAVYALSALFSNEFFVAGYASGSVAVYSVQNAIPLSVLSSIFDGPVDHLHLVEPGRFFISASENKLRYHHVLQLSHERAEQKITVYYQSPYSIGELVTTHSLNEDGSYLKFQHLLLADARFDQQSGTLRFLRMVDNSNRLTDEGEVETFTEHLGNNSVRDLILLEPRKKRKTVWALTFGTNHKIKFWELRSTNTASLKLWEKNIDDFLKAPGQSIIKAKLLYETHEYANLKWGDVSPKTQVLSAYENTNQGKIVVKFAVVDHASKNAVDIFDLELILAYQ